MPYQFTNIILCRTRFALSEPHLTKDSFVFLYVMAIKAFNEQCARDKISSLNRGGLLRWKERELLQIDVPALILLNWLSRTLKLLFP